MPSVVSYIDGIRVLSVPSQYRLTFTAGLGGTNSLGPREPLLLHPVPSQDDGTALIPLIHSIAIYYRVHVPCMIYFEQINYCLIDAGRCIPNLDFSTLRTRIRG